MSRSSSPDRRAAAADDTTDTARGRRGPKRATVTTAAVEANPAASAPPRTAAEFSHQFLIAMPAMVDSIFHRALIYICEHSAQGAIGVMVNRPLGMDIHALFKQVDIELRRPDLAGQSVYFGGPVQTDRGFVLHQPLGKWQSTIEVRQDTGLTSSRDVLLAMSEGGGPERVLLSLGYSGWSAGQLEQELKQNAWLSVEADTQLIFQLPPEARYDAALRLLGVDLARLSSGVGHA